jgi:hypothetical protein
MPQDPLQDLFGSQGPESVKDLEDPAFLRYARNTPGVFDEKGHVIPQDQDYDLSAKPTTIQEQANQYRLACARRLIRLWREWKAQQS